MASPENTTSSTIHSGATVTDTTALPATGTTTPWSSGALGISSTGAPGISAAGAPYIPSAGASGMSSAGAPGVTSAGFSETSAVGASGPSSTGASESFVTSATASSPGASLPVTTDHVATISSTSGPSSNSTLSGSTVPTLSKHAHTPGLAPGAVAGAAIGSAVGAAILAAIMTYLLMRSRLSAKRRNDYNGSFEPEHSSFAMGKSYHSATMVQGVESGDWTRHLPQPADDSFITKTIETIYQQIELHVDNFYSNASPSIDRMSENTRALMSEMNTGLVRPSLSEAMIRRRHKKTLVKQTLARLILSNMTIEDGSPGSLLPRDVAELQRSLQTVAKHQTSPATSNALAYTRVLASYLRPAPFEDQALLARRDSTIKTMANTFCVAFEPWALKETTSKTRYSSLVEIMRGAATGGFLLFSQRATYKFDWDLKDKKDKKVGNSVVVLPGFAKITDDEARPLHRAFVYRSQVVEELK